MFTKVSLLVTSLLVTLAVADYPPPQPGTIDMCCSTVGGINNPVVVQTAVGAGIEILDFPGPYGIGCDAIAVFSDPCPNTAVNCDIDDLNDGLIYTACFPIIF